jgi:beta-barrel assembly-enhancing protease
VSTSEFDNVRSRIAMLLHRKLDASPDPSRPTLRRAPGSSNSPVDADDDGTKPKTDEDDRPTLKRRVGG